MPTLTIELTEADLQLLAESGDAVRRIVPVLAPCWTIEREAAAIVASAVRGRMIPYDVAKAALEYLYERHAAPPHSAPQRDVAAMNKA